MEIGLYSFAENTPDLLNGGRLQSPVERLKDLLEEIELADQLGLDFYGLGEHHRPDFVASAPVTILAAAAARTKSIRLSTAVTVLSSEDPIRVWQQFATVDLLSNGRAEIMAGRGSFIESFPLFGYQLDDYDTLFEEKLELLLKLRDSERVTWSGKHRAPLEDAGVYPRPLQDPLPVWIAVGGTPQSVVRAALLGLPLAIAIIGGEPEHFAPLTRFYREAATRRARLDADGPQAIRDGSFAPRSARCRQPGGGRTEDPLRARALRPQALYGADQRRHDTAREGNACHRALRHRGSSRRPQGDRAPIDLECRRTSSHLSPPAITTAHIEPAGRSTRRVPRWRAHVVGSHFEAAGRVRGVRGACVGRGVGWASGEGFVGSQIGTCRTLVRRSILYLCARKT